MRLKLNSISRKHQEKDTTTISFNLPSLKPLTTLFMLVMICLFTGCSCNRTRVVLLPDHDNHVGQVEITNAHGSTLLDQAGYGVTLREQDAPREAVAIEEKEIQTRFGSVLGAEPELPAKFILQFKSGSDILTDESLARVPEIVTEIKNRSSMDISVAGHSDRVGNEDANIALSLKRAQRVLNLLLDQGIDARFIQASSHGEGNPLVPTADDVPEPKNRRVEVIVR